MGPPAGNPPQEKPIGDPPTTDPLHGTTYRDPYKDSQKGTPHTEPREEAPYRNPVERTPYMEPSRGYPYRYPLHRTRYRATTTGDNVEGTPYVGETIFYVRHIHTVFPQCALYNVPLSLSCYDVDDVTPDFTAIYEHGL
jgi:hypothetical protein